MKRSLLAVAVVFILGSYTIPGKSRALRMGAGIADSGAASGQLSGCHVCSILVYCWSCLNTLPGGSGGPICVSECSSCHLMGICSTAGGHGGFDDDDDDDALEKAGATSSSATPSKLRLPLKASTITQIAAQYPRLGIALAKINREGGFMDLPSRMYVTPIQLTDEDVDVALAPGFTLPAEYEKQLNARAKTVNEQVVKGEVKPVIYDIRPKGFDTEHPTVRIKVKQGFPSDPSYTALVLKFSLPSTRIEATGSTQSMADVQWELLK
jgi:hypothetical protein